MGFMIAVNLWKKEPKRRGESSDSPLLGRS
jgi:hypothetical protein